jgi:hypothetical protein
MSVQFDPELDPATRLVTGLPTAIYGMNDAQRYGKELAPESLKEAPYCPFKADVYQVGWCLCEFFCVRPSTLRFTSSGSPY